MLCEAPNAALPGRQVVGEVGTRGGPADGRTERDGAVEIVHADHALQDQVDAFPPHSRGHASHDISGNRLLEDDREAAEGPQILDRAIHARRRRPIRRDDLDDWNQLRRIERVCHEAAVEPAHAAEDLRRRQAARRRADQRVLTRLLFDADEELLLRRDVFVNRLDDPIGIPDRFGEELRAHQLREAALHDALRRAIECHERTSASLDLDRRALHGPGVQVENRDRPSGRRAQRRPADADVAGADHGNLAGNRHAIASSTSAPASTRSNSSRRTGGGWTSIATRVNEPFGFSFVRPRLWPSSRSTTSRRSLKVSTSGWSRYAMARTSLITAPSNPSCFLWNST